MRLNGLFRDNMVFQRDKEIRIFGETSYNGKVTVKATFKGKRGKKIQTGETKEIYEDGFFIITMPALPKGGPYTLVVEAVGETRSGEDIFFDRYPSSQTIKNVYFGEVWVAGGQNNMEYPLIRTEGAKYLIPTVPETNVHFYKVPVASVYDEKQRMDEDKSSWSLIDKNTCGDMSGVAFYFIRMIEEYLKEHDEDSKDLHFGVIGCYAGGSSIACWQSLEALKSTKAGTHFIDEYNEECSKVSEDLMESTFRQYSAQWAGYINKCTDVLKQNPYTTYAVMDRLIGPGPWPPPASHSSILRPGALYETMLLRLIPFSLRGVIFYQGEADCAEHAHEYATVFETMIKDWREAFWDEKLPFIFCQLPMYISKDRKFMGYDDLRWPKLRDEQYKVSRKVPNTYMAVLSDCGEFDNVHPSEKKIPGERLAKLALRFIYGIKDVPAVAPYVIDVRRGEGVEISFGGDFNLINLATTFAVDESGFEVAGEDGVFYPAQANIDFDGKTVILTSSTVEFPEIVRYAYFSYGMANLTTDTGLAAAPFEAKVDTVIGEFY